MSPQENQQLSAKICQQGSVFAEEASVLLLCHDLMEQLYWRVGTGTQGSTPTVNRWPLRPVEIPQNSSGPVKKTSTGLTGPVNMWDILVNKFPLKNIL